MDLDKVKKSWSEIESHTTIDEKTIKEILSNKTKSAFNKLLKIEKIGIYTLMITLIVTFFIRNENLRYSCIFIVCISSIWQVYKYSYLKKTDLMRMSIVETSERISKYRVYLYRELIVSIVGAVIFNILFCYFVIHYDYTHKLNKSQIPEFTTILIFSIWMIIIVPSASWIFLKRFYFKNIKNIELSLKEVKEYKEEN